MESLDEDDVGGAIADLEVIASSIDALVLRMQTSCVHQVSDDEDLLAAMYDLKKYVGERNRSGTIDGRSRQKSRVEALFYAPTVRAMFDQWRVSRSMRPSQVPSALLQPRLIVINGIRQLQALAKTE